MTIETLVAADYLQVRRRHFDRAVAFHSVLLESDQATLEAAS